MIHMDKGFWRFLFFNPPTDPPYLKYGGRSDSGNLGTHSNNLESRMADNRYSYNGHTNLQPGDLFFWVAVDQLCKRFGFTDLAAAAGILLG
nr:hypothetical protein [Burkholderia aenigmatica]